MTWRNKSLAKCSKFHARSCLYTHAGAPVLVFAVETGSWHLGWSTQDTTGKPNALMSNCETPMTTVARCWQVLSFLSEPVRA